jgi:hypothetical protein
MGRGRERHQKSRKGVDESDLTQTGQKEEIASPPPRTSPRRGRPEEKAGMNQSDFSQITTPQCTSLHKAIPKDNKGIYPGDPSQSPQKDPDSQIAYQHAAIAISPNAHQSSEAPLFLIDPTRAPSPNPALLLQNKITRN